MVKIKRMAVSQLMGEWGDTHWSGLVSRVWCMEFVSD